MDRDENELIKIIKSWYPFFELDKEAYMLLPDEIIWDVKDLAHKYNVKIQILKMRRRTRYTFVAWIPRNKTNDEENDEEDIEFVEKEDDNMIKQMVYDFVKEKKECKVKDIKNFFVTKGIVIGDDKIRGILRQLYSEGKINYSARRISLR
jgi:hypothetical protein